MPVRRFLSIFHEGPSAIIEIAPDGTIAAANERFLELSGYAMPDVIGLPATRLVPEFRRERLTMRLETMLSGGDAISYEGLLLRRDGVQLTVVVDMLPIRDGPSVAGIFALMKDVTSERAMERQSREQQERLRALYIVATSKITDPVAQIEEALTLGVQTCKMPYGFITQIERGILTVRYRVGPDGLFPVGHTVEQTQAIGGDTARAGHAIAEEDLTAGAWAAEVRARNLPWRSFIGAPLLVDGMPYGALTFTDVHPRVAPFETADLEFVEIMGSMLGAILARQQRENELERKAFHDRLTGIANRALFEEYMDRVLSRARRTHERFIIHYIDLNGFKSVNDTYGHAAGDEVLCEVARRLTAAVRDYDVVARFGGDEFVVLTPFVKNDDAVEEKTSRLRAVLEAPIHLSNSSNVIIGASIGVAGYPEHGEEIATLISAADAAMYANKRTA